MIFEANISVYKQPAMCNSLIRQLRKAVPDLFIRIWDQSPEPLEIIGASDYRHSRFNPSVSRFWNWSIGQSKSDWVLVANEDIRLKDSWYKDLLDEMKYRPNSLWFGPSRFFFFNKKLLDLVGWFDERFLCNTYEDLDYIRRMNYAGVQSCYGRDSSLWCNAESLKGEIDRPLEEGGNGTFFRTKYNDHDGENFYCKPNFDTPDFYPQRPK